MLRNSLLTVSHTLHFIFLSLIVKFQRHLGIYYLCGRKSYTAKIYSNSAFKILSQQLFSTHWHTGIFPFLIYYGDFFNEKSPQKVRRPVFQLQKPKAVLLSTTVCNPLIFIIWGLVVHSLQELKENFVQYFCGHWWVRAQLIGQLCFNMCG